MKNGHYTLVVAPPDYPGFRYRNRYVYEHPLVWWKNTGELIDTSKYVIHHKDENKRNNVFENLELKTISQHNREHMRERRPAKWVNLICECCGNAFKRRHNKWTTPAKNGQTKFYCSRSCAGNHKKSPEERVINSHNAYGYARGCRCEECRRGHRERIRKYRQNLMGG